MQLSLVTDAYPDLAPGLVRTRAIVSCNSHTLETPFSTQTHSYMCSLRVWKGSGAGIGDDVGLKEWHLERIGVTGGSKIWGHRFIEVVDFMMLGLFYVEMYHLEILQLKKKACLNSGVNIRVTCLRSPAARFAP